MSACPPLASHARDPALPTGRVSSSSAPRERLPKTSPSDMRHWWLQLWPGTPRHPHAEVPGLWSPERDAEHPGPCPAPPLARFSQTPFPGRSAGLLCDWQVSRVGRCRRTGSPQGHACLAVGSPVGLASALLGGDSALRAQHLPPHTPVCSGWAGAPVTQLVGLPCPLSLSPESGPLRAGPC